MIKLYQFSTSPFTEKVRRALNYKQIEFAIEEVARASVPSGEYAHISPTGKFPAIEDDGKAVWDSSDIIHHLEKVYADKPLIPTDPRDAATAHVIEDWADESLYFYEMTMRLAWEHNLEDAMDEFAATMPGVPKEQLKPMILQGVQQLTQAQGLGRKPKDQVVADVERHFTALDAMLEGRNWLVGEAISYADLAVISQVNALLGAKEAEESYAKTCNIEGWMTRVDKVAPKC